jgi:dihydropteroate synthase
MLRVRRIYARSKDDLLAELAVLGTDGEKTWEDLTGAETVLLKLERIPQSLKSKLELVNRTLGGLLIFSDSDSDGDALFSIKRQELGYLREFLGESEVAARQIDFDNIIFSEGGKGQSFRVGEREYQRIHKPLLMGILNVTPDSFSDGGQFLDAGKAAEHAHQMVEEGADFIDIGGESSRPGSDSVSAVEEADRVIPVLTRLAREIEIPLSIDTTKADVAERAIGEGVSIVNDISAMQWDPRMAEVVSKSRTTIVLMHMKGRPKLMQANPHYDDLVGEIYSFLADRTEVALQAGIEKERILVDPGIGFGKRIGDNFEILGRLREFTSLGPVLIGPSRKSFIGHTLDLAAGERSFGTAGATSVATLNGADVLRIHNVKVMSQVVEITSRCMYDTGQ